MSFTLPSSVRIIGWLSTVRGSLQFLQKFFLALAQLGRNLHANVHVEIAFAVAIQHRHAFVADAERRAGLGALGNLKCMFAFKCGHLNLSAHRRLRH